jgi:hypothetical protein
MTTKQAIKVVRQIILDNQENGELEGVLNRHRIAALNRLVRIAELKTKRQKKSAKRPVA